MTKEALIRILKCYKESIEMQPHKNTPVTSTPIKRKTTSHMPPAKRAELDDTISDISSFFGGLLNTPEKDTAKVSIPQLAVTNTSSIDPRSQWCTKEQSSIIPSILKKCIQELTDARTRLSDITIYAYCVRFHFN